MANNYKGSRKRQKKQSEIAPEQVFIEGFFQGVWHILSWLFRQVAPRKKQAGNKAKLEALREHWEQVELHILQGTTHALAISEADKILDSALKISGFSGETMGNRLKSSESRFDSSLYNNIWQAHKLRNTLAHEIGAQVSTSEAQKAIATFRQALYQLGVLL